MSSSIQPARQAISSTQPILYPWRASTTWTNWLASMSPSNVPVSNQAVPRGSTVTARAPLLRYASLTPVISSSPRGLGFRVHAMSTTSLS